MRGESIEVAPAAASRPKFTIQYTFPDSTLRNGFEAFTIDALFYPGSKRDL